MLKWGPNAHAHCWPRCEYCGGHLLPCLRPGSRAPCHPPVVPSYIYPSLIMFQSGHCMYKLFGRQVHLTSVVGPADSRAQLCRCRSDPTNSFTAPERVTQGRLGEGCAGLALLQTHWHCRAHFHEKFVTKPQYGYEEPTLDAFHFVLMVIMAMYFAAYVAIVNGSTKGETVSKSGLVPTGRHPP